MTGLRKDTVNSCIKLEERRVAAPYNFVDVRLKVMSAFNHIKKEN